MGCLLVKIENLRKKPVVDYERKGGVTANIGLVCATSIGEWEFLACSDFGLLQTVDNEYILVKKNNHGV